MARRCRSCKLLVCECSRRPATSAAAFFYGASFHNYDSNHPALRSPQQPTSDGAAQLTTGAQERLATETADHDSGEAAASEAPVITGSTPSLGQHVTIRHLLRFTGGSEWIELTGYVVELGTGKAQAYKLLIDAVCGRGIVSVWFTADNMKPAFEIAIVGASSKPWVEDKPYRVLGGTTFWRDIYTASLDEAKAIAGSPSNWEAPLDVELSPRCALAPREEHPADEPSPEPWVGPTAGNLEAYDYADGVLGEQ